MQESPSKVPRPLLAPAALVLILGVLIRLLLITAHPVIYGGDSVMRMMNADKIVLAYQLPFLQLLIYGANLLSNDPTVLRWLMVALGGLAGAAFYGLSSILWGREIGLVCALLFTVNPLILVHSLVPYQEILMLLALSAGLAFLFKQETKGNLALASLCLGLACLTRYEAWIVTAAAALFHWKNDGAKMGKLFTWQSSLRTLALFGWAPLLWTVWQGGLSPSGTFVIEGFREWERFYRIPYILGMTLYHAGPLVTLLAAAGLVECWKKRLWLNPRIQMLLLCLLLFFPALIFSAHGVSPNPIRYVTDRETHWPLLFVMWAAGLGLYQLKKRLAAALHRTAGADSWWMLYHAVFGLCLLWGVYETNRRVVHLASQPRLKLDYQVARFLDLHLRQGKKALILADPLPIEAIQDYLDRAYHKSGPRGLAAAQQIVEALDTGPFDYSRIVVNSKLGKNRILHLGQLNTSSSNRRRLCRVRSTLSSILQISSHPAKGKPASTPWSRSTEQSGPNS
ncbi:MAG: glycosyltransferase family 39 protein [Acidobacteria bacterium]|nr:glycosyltransferase family 39 protein [Acidobacteriota bacterium]